MATDEYFGSGGGERMTMERALGRVEAAIQSLVETTKQQHSDNVKRFDRLAEDADRREASVVVVQQTVSTLSSRQEILIRDFEVAKKEIDQIKAEQEKFKNTWAKASGVAMVLLMLASGFFEFIAKPVVAYAWEHVVGLKG